MIGLSCLRPSNTARISSSERPLVATAHDGKRAVSYDRFLVHEPSDHSRTSVRVIAAARRSPNTAMISASMSRR